MEPVRTPCPKCQKLFSAQMPVCPMCGHRVRAPSVTPSRAEPPRAELPREPSPPVVPLTDPDRVEPPWAPAADAPGGPYRGTAPVPDAVPMCPVCDAPAGARSILIETRESFGIDWLRLGRAREELRLGRVEAPGMCEAHAVGLERLRIRATAVAAAAFVLPVWWAGSRGFGMVMAAVAVLLGVDLLRGPRYGWVDSLIYGRALQASLSAYVPAPDGDRRSLAVRFPTSTTHAVLRVLACAALVAATALLLR